MSTLILEFNESDKKILDFIARLRDWKMDFRVEPSEPVEPKKTKEQFFAELKESLDWIAAYERGEVQEEQTIDALLDELDQIAAEAETTL
jgi:hypothetical protein